MKIQYRFLSAAAVALLLSACGQGASPAIPASGAAASQPLASLRPAHASPLIRGDRSGISISPRLLNELPPREAARLRRTLATPHDGGVAYLIAIPGITGLSVVTGYVGWNEIDTFVVSGSAKNSTLTITRRADSTTPPLLTDLFGGKAFSGVDPSSFKGTQNVTQLDALHEQDGGEQPYLTLTFGKPIATAFESDSGVGFPTETWTITFSTLKFCFGTTCNTTDLRG
jgi:hypothetical protein